MTAPTRTSVITAQLDTVADVRRWYRDLTLVGLNCNPDDRGADIVHGTGVPGQYERTWTDDEAPLYDATLARAWDITLAAGVDIHLISLRALDAPRGPRQVRHCGSCTAMVWAWYGRLYQTREGALAARPMR